MLMPMYSCLLVQRAVRATHTWPFAPAHHHSYLALRVQRGRTQSHPSIDVHWREYSSKAHAMQHKQTAGTGQQQQQTLLAVCDSSLMDGRVRLRLVLVSGCGCQGVCASILAHQQHSAGRLMTSAL